MPDHSDDDVPTVLHWRQRFAGLQFPNASVKNAIGPSPLDQPMHVRKFGENFCKPVMRIRGVNAVRVTQHGEDAVFLTGQSVADMLSSFDDVGVFATQVPGETFQRRLRKNGGNGLSDFESVERHDLESNVAAIRDRLRKYLLVDGTFYERCPEPVVVVFTAEVEIDGERTNGTFALVTTDPHLLRRIDGRAEVFEMEDYGAALAKARRANSSRKKKEALNRANEEMAPRIDQVESIYATDAAWMRRASRLALGITDWIGAQAVSGISEELFEAFKKLHKSLHMNEDDERFDVMGDAFSKIVAECGGDRATAHLAKQAGDGLAVLDDRPVSVAVNAPRVPRP
ncbi:hypothetical protein GOB57_21990 [Sinorhizobium meliloti]|nr:hypothetical protein [Sinorhizobium meliloti]